MIRVALVHDWLTGMRGGEAVLEAIVELFPNAELFTLLCFPDKISPKLNSLKCHTSWLQKVPGIENRYRHFLPIMPSVIEQFDLSKFDLIISSSHCVAKGVRKGGGAIHISYVHTPMRYIWSRYPEYFGPNRASIPTRIAAKLVRKNLQNWDRRVSSPERVDHIISNSNYIAKQILENYQRTAEVIYPFADIDRFQIKRTSGKNYLMVGAFAPYKRIDIAIQAFNRLKLPLDIVGTGQNEKELKSLAGPTIKFLGPISNQAIAELYSTCKAFLFPGVEDFGITPIEAMAAGAPVIALKEGGALETITEKTGIFFHPQTETALAEAIQLFESGKINFSESDCRAQGGKFTKQRFQKELTRSVSQIWEKSGRGHFQFDPPVR